jgi:TRAP-type uncharacterized transport system fused permease subunit
MGVVKIGATLAVLYAAIFALVSYLAVYLLFKYLRKAEFPGLITCLGKAIRTHAELTSELTILLATLGILVGLLTVTGFMLRLGIIMMEVAEWNVYALIGIGFLFGWLVGLGVPPSATYILVAIVIVAPFMEWGINPWVAHFFAFFLGILSELSPPTSLTAAVASKISGASFMRTMFQALKICSPIFILTFAIFQRYNVVVAPGILQLIDVALLSAGSLGLIFALFGIFSKSVAIDLSFRMFMGLIAMMAFFHPQTIYAGFASFILVPLLVWGIYQHRRLSAQHRQNVVDMIKRRYS